MTVAEVKAQIQSGNLSKFYIFAGQEWAVQRIYIDMIAKVSGKSLKYIDSITDVYSTLRNRSFIKQSYVYIARDDKEFMQNEKLQEQIEQVLNDNMFILLCTTLDKRTKFYKAYKNSIVEFESLKSDILKKYIKKEIDLSDANCEKLMEVCGFDYGKILLEINKIKNYVNYLETHTL